MIINIIFLSIFGAVFGSFAGAMVHRIKLDNPKEGPSTTNDTNSSGNSDQKLPERSVCMNCGHRLSFLDLLPMISWIGLRGKCRYCGSSVGIMEISVEVIMAVVFAGSYVLWQIGLYDAGSWVNYVFFLLFCVGLAILFIYDLRHYLLPDVVVFSLIGMAAIYSLVNFYGSSVSIYSYITSVVLTQIPVAGVYYALYAISGGRLVGFGDVKLGIFMGLALGSWQLGFLALFLSNIIGVISVIPSMISGKLKRQSRIPFGPFLIIGFIIALISGDEIIDVYINALESNLFM